MDPRPGTRGAAVAVLRFAPQAFVAVGCVWPDVFLYLEKQAANLCVADGSSACRTHGDRVGGAQARAMGAGRDGGSAGIAWPHCDGLAGSAGRRDLARPAARVPLDVVVAGALVRGRVVSGRGGKSWRRDSAAGR